MAWRFAVLSFGCGACGGRRWAKAAQSAARAQARQIQAMSDWGRLNAKPASKTEEVASGGA